MSVHQSQEAYRRSETRIKSNRPAKKFNALLRDTLVNDDHLLERLENFKLDIDNSFTKHIPTLEHFAPAGRQPSIW